MKKIFLFFSLFGIFFLPSLIMTAFSTSSMAAGLMLIVILILFKLVLTPTNYFVFHSKKKIIAEFIIIGIPVFIFLHGLISYYYFTSFNFQRFFLSYILMTIMTLTAWGFSRYIFSTNQNNLIFILKLVVAFFIFNALIGLSGLKLFSHMTHKPVGLFAEPSHLAITIAPIIAFFSIIKLPKIYLILSFFIVWAILINNFTMILVVMFGLGLGLQTRRDIKHFIYILFMIFAVSNLIDLEYFRSRANLSSDSENLSVLVILQGWDVAKQMILKTSFLGAGFQQFGIINVNSDIMDKVTILANRELNILDGGTTASKIVGEFGIIGILFILALITYLINLLKMIYTQKMHNITFAFFTSCILSFIFELFVRGVGYFSPSVFLFLIGIFGLLTNKFNYHEEISK